MQVGIGASVSHPENGMPLRDMLACVQSAGTLDEVIVFRSTGPWSKRWLSATPPYPSKNFHVKGKSSDWGPQAGFVPQLGEYSKVGASVEKAAKGTKLNADGVASGFTKGVVLSLMRDEIQMQFTSTCEVPARTAIVELREFPEQGVILLGSERTGDRKRFNFVAKKRGEADRYDILIPPGLVAGNWLILVDRLKTGKLDYKTLSELKVMVSCEVGADDRAMTGDYDLMAICPRWADHMGLSKKAILKPAIELAGHGGHAAAAQRYEIGSRLDTVLDMRLHTGAKPRLDARGNLVATSPGVAFAEHGDMGNLTPRILRAINQLNIDMGAVGPNTALRRVHHNAESHRHSTFGALKSGEMEQGEGFPLTAFHPQSAMTGRNSLARFGSVCTIEHMTDFRAYVAAVHAAGFFVPKNWSWNMSIRDEMRG